MIPDISQDHSAFIFRVKQSKMQEQQSAKKEIKVYNPHLAN
jgi:hypothetical protein